MKALAWFLAAVAIAAAAADEPTGGRVGIVTRQVKAFSELEATLARTLEMGNVAAVDKMLLDDFEMRVASMPGNPTPRAEWMRLSLGNPARFHIEQMAVHDFGDLCVVSFLQSAARDDRADPANAISTVDVWKRSGDAWKLAVRYAGPAGPPDFKVPGMSNEAPIPKKY